MTSVYRKAYWVYVGLNALEKPKTVRSTAALVVYDKKAVSN